MSEKRFSEDRRVMRPRDAARYLAVGESSIWILASAGELRAVKLSPRVTVFERADLDAYLDRKIAQAKAAA